MPKIMSVMIIVVNNLTRSILGSDWKTESLSRERELIETWDQPETDLRPNKIRNLCEVILKSNDLSEYAERKSET